MAAVAVVTMAEAEEGVVVAVGVVDEVVEAGPAIARVKLEAGEVVGVDGVRIKGVEVIRMLRGPGGTIRRCRGWGRCDVRWSAAHLDASYFVRDI